MKKSILFLSLPAFLIVFLGSILMMKQYVSLLSVFFELLLVIVVASDLFTAEAMIRELERDSNFHRSVRFQIRPNGEIIKVRIFRL